MRLRGLQRNFLPSLNCIEESKLGVFPGIKITTRDKFYLSDPFVSKGKHLITKDLFLLLYELHPFPL